MTDASTGAGRDATADAERAFLRHAVATVAYRGEKTLRGAPEGFATFRIGEGSRTPVEILAHIADLYEWSLHLALGRHVYREDPPLAWEAETERFFTALRRFDEHLASGAPLGYPARRIYQGPIADSLMHFGQLALLRRRAGAPVRGENYFKADIVIGRLGHDQSTERVEFD